MSHLQAIRQLIKSVITNRDHHAIIISGPPGWAKTTTVENALREEGIEPVQLGAYSTSLNFYNLLCQNPNRTILIDDCAKMFTEPASMAILKAATWSNSVGQRIIRWGSTSNRALTNEFEFKGKFVIICNSFPQTPDGEAIRSRSYLRPININAAEGKRLLLDATKDRVRFPEQKVVTKVAKFLADRLTDRTVWKISYRTLRAGYDLVVDHPDNWQDLLAPTLPIAADDPEKLVRTLAKENLKVKEQARIFTETTGKSWRTFFKYRNDAKLTKER